MKNINKVVYYVLVPVWLIQVSCSSSGNSPSDSKMEIDEVEEVYQMLQKDEILCSFQFEKEDADVDYFPILEKNDSTNFEIETWSKKDFSRFLTEHQEYCHKEESDISVDFKINDLFNGTDSIQAEITEIFRSNNAYKKTVILHGNETYCIISHGIGITR